MSTASGVVDVHKRQEGVRLMWTHVDRGGGQKPDFLVDVLNGWPPTLLRQSKFLFQILTNLMRLQAQQKYHLAAHARLVQSSYFYTLNNMKSWPYSTMDVSLKSCMSVVLNLWSPDHLSAAICLVVSKQGHFSDFKINICKQRNFVNFFSFQSLQSKQIIYRWTVSLYKFIGYHNKAYYINRNAPVEQFSVVVHELRQHLQSGLWVSRGWELLLNVPGSWQCLLKAVCRQRNVLPGSKMPKAIHSKNWRNASPGPMLIPAIEIHLSTSNSWA